MQLGDSPATTREPRSRLDEALDTFENSLAELITTVETGGLDHLSAEEKVAVWQRFETIRNRQPLIDHRLIADAEAHHLSEEYCSSTMTQFLIRVLQLSPGDAATRVRAAAAVGPRTTMLGEKLEPVLPQLAALQRDGVVSAEKVAIVERAMHQLTRPRRATRKRRSSRTAAHRPRRHLGAAGAEAVRPRRGQRRRPRRAATRR